MDLTELERNTLIQNYNIDLAEFDFNEVLNGNIIVVHMGNETLIDRMVLRISDKTGTTGPNRSKCKLVF